MFIVGINKGKASISCQIVYLFSPVAHSFMGRNGVPLPPENHKAEGSVMATVMDILNNHKATRPIFSVRPSSARMRNII